MSAQVIPLDVPRPRYTGPVAFLKAMGAIGATGVLRCSPTGGDLGFAVPNDRVRRAEVLIGDRSTWSRASWSECVALVMLMLPGGMATLDAANDEAHQVDLRPLARQVEACEAVILEHKIRAANVGTPAALFRALGAIGGDVVVRRDEDGLTLGFVAPGSRELRLDRLLGGCADHDGDWWLDTVAELGRLFPAIGSLWELPEGDGWRLPLNPIDATNDDLGEVSE